MTPLSPHPGSTAGYPCNSSLIRADLARTPSPAATSSPQPGLLPRCGGVSELPAPSRFLGKAGVITGKTRGKPTHHLSAVRPHTKPRKARNNARRLTRRLPHVLCCRGAALYPTQEAA